MDGIDTCVIEKLRFFLSSFFYLFFGIILLVEIRDFYWLICYSGICYGMIGGFD